MNNATALLAWGCFGLAIIVGPMLLIFTVRYRQVKWRLLALAALAFWFCSASTEVVVRYVLLRPYGVPFLFYGWAYGVIYCYPWFQFGRAIRSTKNGYSTTTDGMNHAWTVVEQHPRRC